MADVNESMQIQELFTEVAGKLEKALSQKQIKWEENGKNIVL